MSEAEKTIGWDAIDAALKPLYPDQEPLHFGPKVHYSDGGDAPLDAVVVYKCQEPVPHWHFITYGFTELYEKNSENEALSGYGFELTFRLMRESNEDEPPEWPLNFLQNLAQYVFSSGNVFDIGHHLYLNGPIALEEETDIHSILFATDPQLGKIDTPLGNASFLQVVGITIDEEMAIKSWNAEPFTKILEEQSPYLTTDLNRTSILKEPEIEKKVSTGIKKEGSNTGIVFVTQLDWQFRESEDGKKEVDVRLGAGQVNDLKVILPNRIAHGHGFLMEGLEKSLGFLPDPGSAFEMEDELLTLFIDQDTTLQLIDSLEPKIKSFSLTGLPGVTFYLEKTEILNQEGKVVQTIP
jgi:suppressor of fused